LRFFPRPARDCCCMLHLVAEVGGRIVGVLGALAINALGVAR
jgi:hypothetical protein